MDKEEIKKLITGLNVWKRGDQRAPHKPLLLLYALSRCLQDRGRLIPYEDADRELKKLLLEFGPPKKAFILNQLTVNGWHVRKNKHAILTS
jgi:putative restriction endonuclease